MDVLVDTPIWSLAFRRSRNGTDPSAHELAYLIREGRARMIGAIRQEVLSGIRTSAQYVQIRDALRAFPDLLLGTADYEEAALFFNRYRAQGIQGSPIDFLICAVALRRNMAIMSTDRDFEMFARILGVHLHAGRRGPQN